MTITSSWQISKLISTMVTYIIDTESYKEGHRLKIANSIISVRKTFLICKIYERIKFVEMIHWTMVSDGFLPKQILIMCSIKSAVSDETDAWTASLLPFGTSAISRWRIYLPNLSSSNRMWHKVKIQMKDCWFEFRSVLFLECLIKAEDRNLSYYLPIVSE